MPVTGRILLDTSVVVAVLRRVPGMIERLRGQEELLVPLVVLGELRYGANLATPTIDSTRRCELSWPARLSCCRRSAPPRNIHASRRP